MLNMDLMLMLSPVSQEEQAILDGRSQIDRELYMVTGKDTVQADKLLSAGKLITLRTHTRFIHFPVHRHDYVEAVYMCSGSTTHIVNGNTITLRAGELLFMSQGATHEVCTASREDVAVNFIILPEFFNTVLDAMGEEQTPLRRFLVDCLSAEASGYLHFQVSAVVPVQNLIENLLFMLLKGGKRKHIQMTMALLFLELTEHTGMLTTGDREQALILEVLSYVETHYAFGSLTELAQLLHHDLYWLSREIKSRTGKTYTQLVQEKRLAQAAFLLRNTDSTVDNIANAVGYENMGYFHRIFRQAYGASPRGYRILQIR